MSDLRVYGFSIQVENEKGITKVKQFRKAVSDVDGTVEMLNNTLGDNVKVTHTVAQSEKEATAQARLLINQQERQRKKVERVVKQYELANRTIQEYGQDLETVNAITKLGSNATDEQRREVAKLVKQYQNLRSAGDQGRNSFRNLRGVAQNFGWQMQDIAVQLQMGTNQAVIFAQQGSQIASSFGPVGALVGAAIAVIGASLPSLIQYFDNAAVSADKLKESTERLNSLFQKGKGDVSQYTDQLVRLYNTDKDMAQLKAMVGLLDAQKTIKGTTDQLRELDEEFVNLGEGFRWFSDRWEAYSDDVDDLSKKYGINSDQVEQLSNAYLTLRNSGEPDKLVDTFKNLISTTPNATSEFKEMALQVLTLGEEIKSSRERAELLQDLLNGDLGAGTAASKVESLADRFARMTEQIDLNDRQLEIDNFLRKDNTNLTKAQIRTTKDNINTYYDEKEIRDSIIDGLKKEQAERNKAIKETERAHESNSKYLLGLDKSLNDDQSFNDPVGAEIQQNQTRMTELQRIRNTDKSNRKRANQLIEREEKRHVLALKDAQVQLANNQLSLVSGSAQAMTDIADLFANGAERVKESTENMTDFQKTMFFISQSIAAAQALINGISLGMKLAAMFPVASGEMIAVGTALGAAQSGAIMGTTFAGMFDKGGYIPGGQKGIVAEYGDELVNGVMVNGPARVTSREDTAKMMSKGDSPSNTQLNVSIDNSVPNTEYSVEQLNPNDIKIIARQVFNDNIDSGVASVLNSRTSKGSKSMRKNYTTRNRYA